MTTSFVVNLADLTHILKDIRVAELHAATPGMTLSQAIQQIYGVSEANAALLPAGLRTVDGRDNNLLAGKSELGAADTLFPRLTTPKFVNDTDGDGIDFDGAGPAPALVNGNYGQPGSVVDADPRTISNLIVDQTGANRAAIEAALFHLGIEGSAAHAAADAVQSAYHAILNAKGASIAVTQAQGALQDAVVVHSTASAAHDDAQSRQTAFAAASPLAATAATAAGDALTAVDSLIAALQALSAPEAQLTASEAALAPFQANVDGAAATLATAQAALAAELALPSAQQTPGLAATLQLAVDAAQADFTAADTAAQPYRDDVASALAVVVPLREDAAARHAEAVTATAAALTAASAVLAALDPAGTADYAGVAAHAADDAAGALLASLEALKDGSIDSVIDLADLAPSVAARDAFATHMGDWTTSQTEADAGLASANADVATTTATLADATTVLEQRQAAYDAAVAAAQTSGTPEQAAAFLASVLTDYGIEQGPDGGLFIPNLSPDIGLSPGFNSWMTFFGQFFDHGLDLVTKGGNGTIYIPLTPDDPLVAGDDGVFGTADDLPEQLRFMALTRATPTMVNGVPQQENTTTAFVDQNQTYTSHASHQVFLREYVRLDTDGTGMKTLSTGRLLDGSAAGGSVAHAIGDWGDVKAQALTMLGINLSDQDVFDVPLLATDAYGNLRLGPNGFAQIVMAPDAQHATNWLKEGNPDGSVTTAGAEMTGHSFLNDIAHHAEPGRWDSNGDHRITAADAFKTPDADPGVADDNDASTYDDEMLDAHFVTGDGRGNENAALSAVHSIFHSEHNRLVEANKATILASGDVNFINEWLLVDLTPGAAIPTDPNALVWDGSRLFQAARFVTEMQYQHLVFEEFARRIQPAVDPFVFTNSAEIDPSILAEFAHTVYRFGHSMLTETVDRLDNSLQPLGSEQETLIDAFLNPQLYIASGTTAEEVNANLVRGLTRDLGNEIDEFVVPALRNNLVGLPLDLPALNIARGRDTGIPSLNETRRQLYQDFGAADLKPYTSWADFAQHIKNPASVVNFIAAYGTHSSILAATTLDQKRAAAMELVTGVDENGDHTVAADRLDFLSAKGVYAGASLGGLNDVDLWIGGLAEEKFEFGGMLGSTFNFIFEYQLEHLQNGDRLYYLSRTQGMNLLNQLEPNTFTDLVMRNTDLGDVYATHLNGALFTTPDHILELDRAIAQEGADPEWQDSLQQAIDPKVVREASGVVDANGHDVGGTLKFSGGEHVVLGGTEGDDTLIGDKGIDTLWGDGGNDYLNAGMESDEVFGGLGDDVIEDPFGDDLLRGNQGNDVISSARGADILFGGEGRDVLILGQDASEVFAGEGDDFVLGGSGGDNLLGNEGSDWIEGGDGFDAMTGDNSELFFNSPIVGHDVLWAQGNDTDYDMETGDDIALTGSGVQRFEGMRGFDWAGAKYDPTPVDLDLSRKLFGGAINDVLRDRFDMVEAASGWKKDDLLTGDDAGQRINSIITTFLPIGDTRQDHALTQEGIDRIDGLREWLGGALATIAGVVPNEADANLFMDGNILMGGAGSDTIIGKGGYDIIDGDAWLNVRIRVVVDGQEYSAESMNTDPGVAGTLAGKLTYVGGAHDGEVAFAGRSLTSLLLDRTVRPGDMTIVREILTDPQPSGSIDTAVYRGTMAEYQIEGRGLVINDMVQRSYDVDGDGFISVRDLDDGTTSPIAGGASRKVLTDSVDLLKNIEQLQFADKTVSIVGADPVLRLTLDAPANVAATPGAGSLLASLGVTPLGSFTFSLLSGSTPGFAITPSGQLSAAAALGAGTTSTLLVRATGPLGTLDEIVTVRNGTATSNTINGDGSRDIVFGAAGNDTINGAGGNDILYGQAGRDTIGGGDGDDVIEGGAANDILSGGNGADRFRFTIGDGVDAVDGGDGQDRLEVFGTAAANTLSVTWDGAQLVVAGQTLTSVEEITADLGGGTDRITYLIPLGFGIDIDMTAPTLPGFLSVANVEEVVTAAGDDHFRDRSGSQLLDGRGGNDIFDIAVDDAADRFNGSTGSDTANYGAFTTNLSFALATPALVVGSGSSAATSDTLDAIENVVSGSGNDQITGSNAANTLIGGAGNDTIAAAGGNDSVTGGAGDDILAGDAGADVAIYASAAKAFTFGSVGTAALLTDTTGAEGSDQLTGFEQVRLGATSYAVVNGTVANNTNLNGAAGAAGSQIVFGYGGIDRINGGAGDDIIVAGEGDDFITQAAATGGRDIVVGGAGSDTFTLNGDATAEAFTIYARAAAVSAGLGADLAAGTEIVVTRNGTIVAELDDVEEIQVNTLAVSANDGNGVPNGGTSAGDTITIVGDFSAPFTSLNYNTITVVGTGATDVVDISGLTSSHRIVFDTNGGGDQVLGTLRPQDVVDVPAPAGQTLPHGVFDHLPFEVSDLMPEHRFGFEDMRSGFLGHNLVHLC